MSSIGSISSAPQKVDARQVPPEAVKEKAPPVESRSASSDAVVAEVRSREEVRNERDAFALASQLSKTIRKTGIDSLNAHQARPAEAVRDLLE